MNGQTDGQMDGGTDGRADQRMTEKMAGATTDQTQKSPVHTTKRSSIFYLKEITRTFTHNTGQAGPHEQ